MNLSSSSSPQVKKKWNLIFAGQVKCQEIGSSSGREKSVNRVFGACRRHHSSSENAGLARVNTNTLLGPASSSRKMGQGRRRLIKWTEIDGDDTRQVTTNKRLGKTADRFSLCPQKRWKQNMTSGQQNEKQSKKKKEKLISCLTRRRASRGSSRNRRAIAW